MTLTKYCNTRLVLFCYCLTCASWRWIHIPPWATKSFAPCGTFSCLKHPSTNFPRKVPRKPLTSIAEGGDSNEWWSLERSQKLIPLFCIMCNSCLLLCCLYEALCHGEQSAMIIEKFRFAGELSVWYSCRAALYFHRRDPLLVAPFAAAGGIK